MEHIKSQIKENDDVIFYAKPYNDDFSTFNDGTVGDIHKDGVRVYYLEGYKSRSELIKWEDLVLIGDMNGERFKIRGYSGRGRILNDRFIYDEEFY